MVVHECVHVLIDAEEMRITALASEMCAYIAQQIYLENLGVLISDENAINFAARALASRVLAKEDLNMPAAAADKAKLIEAIQSSKLYWFTKRHPWYKYGGLGIDDD